MDRHQQGSTAGLAGHSADQLCPPAFEGFRAEWILHEDEDLIVLNKPAGISSQAADASHPDDIVSRLRAFLALRAGCDEERIYLGVHQRLDQETSGVLLLTRRPEANAVIADQFARRAIGKEYLACVAGFQGQARTLRHHLAKGRDGSQVVVDGRARAKLAVTHVAPIERVGERTLVRLGCETGRTHQLRVQLATIGCPIAGDGRYGGPPAPRLLLHAKRLRMQHPDGSMREWEAPLPDAFALWMARGMAPELDTQQLRAALPTAVARRYRAWLQASSEQPTTAFRLVHGEADGLPGLAVDVYGEFLVAHLFDGAFAAEDAVVQALSELGFAGIYLKRHPKQKNVLADAQARELCPVGPVWGRAAPDPLIVHEYGVPLPVRLGDGLRTGLFLDQRANRQRVGELACGKRLLNLFAYTCGFSVVALSREASAVVSVDVSGAALSRGSAHIATLGKSARHRAITGDVFEVLPRMQRRGELFDVIVLDPPSYATTKRRRFRAIKDYPKLVAAALPLLAPGGSLLSCINHHQVSSAQFRALILAGAAGATIGLTDCRELPLPRDFPGAQPLFKTWLCRRA